MSGAIHDVLWNLLAPGAASWLATYAIHSTILLCGAWLVTGLLRLRHLPLQDLLWKAALVGGVLTASLQLALGVRPVAGRIALTLPAHPHASVPLSASSPAPSLPVAPELAERGSASSTAMASLDAAAPTGGSAAEWVVALLALWGLGAAGYLAVLALSLVHLRQLLRERRPVREGALPEMLARLRATLRRPARVELTASREINVPFALAREICVPERAATELARDQQESMLAHELAHVVRRDPTWLVLARLVESVLFFQPLNRLARRRLQEGAEYLCDDWAVSRTGHGLTLARCLTEVAEWTLASPQPLAVVGMVDGSTSLRRRIGRLVEGAGAVSRRRPRWMAPATVGGVALLAFMLPGVTSARSDPAPPPAPAPVSEPAPATAPAAVPESVAAPRTPTTPMTPTTPVTAPAPMVAPASPASPAPPASPFPDGDELQARIETLTRRITELAEKLRPSDEELQRLEEEAARAAEAQAKLSAEDQSRLAELARRAAEGAKKHQAEIEALGRKLEEKAAACLSPEEKARLDAVAEKLSSRNDTLTPEERQRLRAELRELTDRMRPDRAEIERLARQMAQLGQEMKPSREELERLKAQALEIAKRVQPTAEQRQAIQRQAQELVRRTQAMRRDVERELRARERELESLQRELARRERSREAPPPTPMPTP
jgi:beta-lactamase regulating signal transducer with metallopeptidase domain